MIPFTTEQFLAVFAQYNLAVWPAQVLLYGVALCTVVMAVQRRFDASAAISVILAALWLWSGVGYHLIFFTKVNQAAYVFAAFFILQSFLFLYVGLFYRQLGFRFRWNVTGLFGAALILYALVIYPILNYQFDHAYPFMPTLGVPCPTTIFTFGMLTWADSRPRPSILIIPAAWSLVGFSAALSLGMIEDLGLVVAALVSSLFLSSKPARTQNAEREVSALAESSTISLRKNSQTSPN